MIRFFKGDRNGEVIEVKDDQRFLDVYTKIWKEFNGDYTKLVIPILAMEDHWDINLSKIEGMTEMVAKYVEIIDTKGMKEAIKEVV